MSESANYCTCKNLKCSLHPANHDKGCTPCIRKNLKLGEVPNCFFNLLEGAENRSGDTFGDFADIVLKQKTNYIQKP